MTFISQIFCFQVISEILFILMQFHIAMLIVFNLFSASHTGIQVHHNAREPVIYQ